MEIVERGRANLTAASDMLGLLMLERPRPEPQRSAAVDADGDALMHLDAARTELRPIFGPLRRADPRLRREILVAFERVERAVKAEANPELVRERVEALAGQLMDGVLAALLSREARFDFGLRAEVLRRILPALSRQYAVAVAPPPPATTPPPPGTPTETDRRLAYERAFGVLVRIQSLARGISPSLGGAKNAVGESFRRLREQAFPDGIARPQDDIPPLEDVQDRVERAQKALVERYRLDG